jgi:hypothetical protein
MTALWQSLACFYAPILALGYNGTDRAGSLLGLWEIGTVSYTLIITVVSPHLSFDGGHNAEEKPWIISHSMTALARGLLLKILRVFKAVELYKLRTVFASLISRIARA